MTDGELITKIKSARKYAKEYFKADQAEDTRLVDEDLNFLPPRFFVEFTGPDTMRVCPSVIGTPSQLWFEYRLAFRSDGSIAWEGWHPVYSHVPLKIVEVPRL
jgi:hypothetical protein